MSEPNPREQQQSPDGTRASAIGRDHANALRVHARLNFDMLVHEMAQ